jgi:signal peptidase II
MLTLFRAIAVVFGFFLLNRIIARGYHKGAIISGILILAGAAGNLIDCIFYGTIFSESSFHIASIVQWGHGYERIFHGRVVDMLYFPLFDVQLPDWIPIAGGKRFAFFEEVFNIADAAVCTGTGLLVVFQKKFIHKKSNIPASI